MHHSVDELHIPFDEMTFIGDETREEERRKNTTQLMDI